MAHLFIIINENFTEYSLNVTLLSANYRNEYILTVSSKKIIENMIFFCRINLAPPPPLNGGPGLENCATIMFILS